MKRIRSLNVLECPACNSQDIHLTCTRIRNGDTRVRYKRCKACGHAFITEQKLTKELIIQPITKEQKRNNNPWAKLTVQDVMEIKYFLAKKSFTCAELALQYEVSKNSIWSIERGQTWEDIPTPAEYP